DVYLLCSDGLTGMVSEDRMAEILRARSSLDQAARALVDEANAGGGKDNITVVLFKLVDEAAVGPAEESDTLSGTEKLAGVDVGGETAVMGPSEVGGRRSEVGDGTSESAVAATATRQR